MHYDQDVLTATLTAGQILFLMSREEDWVGEVMGPWRDALPNGLTHEKREVEPGSVSGNCAVS